MKLKYSWYFYIYESDNRYHTLIHLKMHLSIIIIFLAGYIAIAMEQSIRIDKAASALVTGVVCWLIYFLNTGSIEHSDSQLMTHLGDISAILFFLMGAMTIVEVIDSHQGFTILTDAIHTRSKPLLLIIISTITFFLSSILDNLTTAIVMTSLCGKLLKEKQDRLWFVSMVIIAANAGGAWSPLGDVTTTMLWIGKQITAFNIIYKTFIPSLVVMIVPLSILILKFRNQQIELKKKNSTSYPTESNIILLTGLGLLIFVPVFKTLTHMPPVMGMLLALGIIWFVSSFIHRKKQAEDRYKYSVTSALRKIDTASILFFLGILLAVSALAVTDILPQIASWGDHYLKNEYMKGTFLGLSSAVIDNVPLVAAAQKMYSLNMYPTDHNFWEFLSLATGTGGSAIIIGSAAGVAVMGIEKISFSWYLKNISWLALAGFFAGLATYLFQDWVF